MSRYKAYAEYKTVGQISKVSIPLSWVLSKVKYIGDYINGFPFKPTQWDVNGMPIIRIQNLSNQNAEINRTEFVPPERYQVRCGDLLISWSATLDVYIWEREDAWLNQHIFLVSINESLTLKKYFYWSAKWFMGELNEASHGSTLQHLTADKFGGFEVPLPPLEVQKTIANFLDYETTKIDLLIEKQQGLIALLKEKCQAVISHAVTKGLNPNAPMKDSGVEWLGEVPEHWEVTRAKFVSNIFIPQRNKPELNEEIGIPWATMEDMKGQYIESTKNYVSSISAKIAGSKTLKSGSVIASCVGSFGVAAINRMDVIINQQLQAFIPTSIKAEYLRETVAMSKNYFELIGTAATLVYVNQQGFENLPVLIPPKNEQDEVCEFIETESLNFIKLTVRCEEAIELMQERRTALISAAVTGKIDVRDWRPA